MQAVDSAKEICTYTTWYEFKKELEQRLGCPLLNWYWLDVKPKDPLPWNNAHLKACLLKVSPSAMARGRQTIGRHTATEVGIC